MSITARGKMKIRQDDIETHVTRSFDPKEAPEDQDEWVGKRRIIDGIPETTLWRWPKNRVDRLRAFDDWHDIGMQIIHRAGASFRLMAVYRRVFRWDECCIWSSDEELAQAAGHCDWKTISREVGRHRALGIIRTEKGWRLAGNLRLRTRTIQLTVPLKLDPAIVVRDLPAIRTPVDPME